MPNAPVSSDVLAMQSAASGTELVLFLSQFEALSGSNSATQQLATSLLNDARNVELALNGFAGGEGVILPGNIAGSDQILAQQMIAGVRGGSTDQTFSILIVQAEASLVVQFEQMAIGAQDEELRAFAASVLPTLQADLAAVQGTGSLEPMSEMASSQTLNSSDLSTLETFYSINLMERFLGQLTVLVTTRSPIALYSAKLIGDHEQGILGLGAYAANTATYLPASIPAMDASMVTSIIAALGSPRVRNSSRYDRVYLQQMVIGHSDALGYTRSVIATAQNPVLRQFAINVEPTINMHLLTARVLARRFGR
jgi:predicted outer membrane protein